MIAAFGLSLKPYLEHHYHKITIYVMSTTVRKWEDQRIGS